MADRKTIGLFVGNSHTDHPRKIIEGFYSASVDTGCDVHFYLGTESSAFSRGSAQLENDFDYQYIFLYDYRKFDRLSANCIALGSLMTQQESSKKEGFVNGFKGEKNLILEDTIALPDSTYMIADNYQGMFACVNHLIEVHGKKKIIYLSGPVGNRDSEEREQAYRDCMKAHGLTVTEKMVTHGDYSEYVDDVVNGLLDANPDADAIASANDEMCQSVYRVLTERRMRVGKDIAVTGFDNVPEAASMTPSLTTVRQRSFELGYRAAGAAFRLAEGEIPKPERVPADFICRKSCGCEEEAPVKPDTENRSLADSVESMRLLLHKALMGPFLIRELNRISADSTLFFYKVGTTMRDLGAKSSFVYLLPEVMENNNDGKFSVPDTLLPAMRQNGDVIYSYDLEKAVPVHPGEGIFRLPGGDDRQHFYFTYLLFDGPRQYGILSVEIAPDQLQFFYMISLQVGTALHFREMAMKEEGYRNQLRKQNEQLQYSATNDELTGIMNRRGVMDRIPSYALDHAGQKAFILIADLDHLKQINDHYGHVEGDFAIRKCADTLRYILGPEAIIGRIGGDEFLAVYPESQDTGKDGRTVRDKLRSFMNDFNTNSDKPYYVELSVGITSFTCKGAPDIAALTRNADARLYEDKSKRRASVAKEA